MSFLLRRCVPWARAGWRDLDALHSRADEDPIRAPWKRVNSARTVWLESNVLKIKDAFETPLQLGGVSYEQQPFTTNWGTEMELNIDGAVLVQEQFFGAAITNGWNSVGFSDLAHVPLFVIHRSVGSTTNELRVETYDDINNYSVQLEIGPVDGLMNRTWCWLRFHVERDRLVRMYINDVLLLEYWLPTVNKAGPNKRALQFLNQTTAEAWIRNFSVFDRGSDFPTVAPWSSLFYDDFNRSGAVGNGWTQFGTNAALVNNSWSTTGTTDGSRGLLRDTGVTTGVQRIEAVVGGNLPPNASADCSLILRANSAGSEGLAANFYANTIFLSRLSGSLTSPTFNDFVRTDDVAIPNGALLAFCCSDQAAWVEVNGQVVLMADVISRVTTANSWAGLRVERSSGANSASWNDARILTRP
ncbi:MAG: hypothetical protein JWN03_1202 [Nocardia sp.]|uniref:hypothetical protein n=1 Tax=Nocardia sp. TaxID=1821 RepID=UPI00260CA328|nr:hypothetical protein [Nocardia sp.]MCU1640927.1 hypothetical protein [Nocardia sp.]